jgi:hypothetical protein
MIVNENVWQCLPRVKNLEPEREKKSEPSCGQKIRTPSSFYSLTAQGLQVCAGGTLKRAIKHIFRE